MRCRWLIVGVVALGLVLSACGGGGSQLEASASRRAPGAATATLSDASSETAQPTAPSALNATAAPLLPTGRFELPELDAATFRALLAQLRGTPVVVNIWASWCGPCKLEAPDLAAAARRFGRRVQFIGVDILDQRSRARAFIRSHGWLYPSVFDPTGAIRTDLGFVGQPDTMFFDRSGRQVTLSAGGSTVRAWTGPITRRALETILRQLVKK